jgi:hypothetical protein
MLKAFIVLGSLQASVQYIEIVMVGFLFYMFHYGLWQRNIFAAIAWISEYIGMARQDAIKGNAIFN